MRRFRTDAFGMHDDPAGDWVAHAQAEYEIAKCERRIAEFKKQHARVLVMYHTGQSRIAQLEAAIDKLAQVAHPGVQSLSEFKTLIEVTNKNLHK